VYVPSLQALDLVLRGAGQMNNAHTMKNAALTVVATSA